MNVQVERLENHTARLTVAVDSERWEAALKQAAQELSKRYRIPGFRKGKAPYKVVKRYLGEAAIVEDTVEKLGNEIYPEALDEAAVTPYAAGSFDDFQLEPEPTYVFSVPLQPEVDLNDYRSVRQDWEQPEITDEKLDETLQQLRKQHAVVEESQHPAKVDDRLTVDVHSEFADGEERSEDEEDDESADEGDDVPRKGDAFFHRHDLQVALTHDTEPVLPGFTDAMVGATVGEEREFELTVPEDEPEYETIAGRKVQFHVTVKKIENVTPPELNDAFAQQLTKDEEEPLSMVELRMRIRENLQREAEREARDEYAMAVLDEMVEQATISYPEVMVDERIHQMIDEFGSNLQQQGIDLETYQKVTGITHEQLHEQYHDSAVQSVKRSVVLGEIMVNEKVRVSEEEIDAEVDALLAQFGPSAESLREFVNQPQQRADIANRLLYSNVIERIAQIGRGEAPSLEELEAAEGSEEEAATETEDAEEQAETENDAAEAAAEPETQNENPEPSAEAETPAEAAEETDKNE